MIQFRLYEIREELALMGIPGNFAYIGPGVLDDYGIPVQQIVRTNFPCNNDLPLNRMDVKEYQQTIRDKTSQLNGIIRRVEALLETRKLIVDAPLVDHFPDSRRRFRIDDMRAYNEQRMQKIDQELYQLRNQYATVIEQYYNFLENTQPVDKDKFIKRWNELIEERGELLCRWRESQCKRILQDAGVGAQLG